MKTGDDTAFYNLYKHVSTCSGVSSILTSRQEGSRLDSQIEQYGFLSPVSTFYTQGVAMDINAERAYELV